MILEQEKVDRLNRRCNLPHLNGTRDCSCQDVVSYPAIDFFTVFFYQLCPSTDLLEPTLLDELICHIGSLASVYHKPPSAFVEGKTGLRKSLNPRSGSGDDGQLSNATNEQQPTVIPSQETLIGDLLSLELNPPPVQPTYTTSPISSYSNVDILGGGLDTLLGGNDISQPAPPVPSTTFPPTASVPIPPVPVSSTYGLLGDIFGIPVTSTFFTPPKELWLSATDGKGLEPSGTFTRRNGAIHMEMTFVNRAMQSMTGFAIQFNKNSFGLAPGQPLTVQTPLQPNLSSDASLPLSTNGPVQKMNPLTNLQVAVKNNVGIFYFSAVVPLHVYCVEDASMDKRVFLSTWKEIPSQNELQFPINGVNLDADAISSKLQSNNVFTIAKRTVEGNDMLYQSFKLTNNMWILAELKIQPGSPDIQLSVKSRVTEIASCVHKMYEISCIPNQKRSKYFERFRTLSPNRLTSTYCLNYFVTEEELETWLLSLQR
uniref:Uncharacterized protein n=1 Tax=Tetranychus urticae TaxID=32264 RepID=T1L495_TETUR